MKKTHLIPAISVLMFSCGQQISLDTYNELTQIHCDCISKLNSLEQMDEECKEEQAAVEKESEAVWTQINQLDKTGTAYRESEEAAHKAKINYFECQTEAMQGVNDREIGNYSFD